jgi:hypothetical protein
MRVLLILLLLIIFNYRKIENYCNLYKPCDHYCSRQCEDLHASLYRTNRVPYNNRYIMKDFL